MDKIVIWRNVSTLKPPGGVIYSNKIKIYSNQAIKVHVNVFDYSHDLT